MVDWPQVVKDHGPLVWQTVYRIVRRDADAADCFQNTFVAALGVSHRETVRHWPALLKRIATAQALNRLGQRQREADRNNPLVLDCGISRDAAPEQSARASELAEQLELALAELDSRGAQVFWLACMEGWSYQDIAAELKISVNHVGVLLNRARAELRNRLHAFNPANNTEHQPRGKS